LLPHTPRATPISGSARAITLRGLNLADCFPYSLAKARDEPLLFKGDDFLKTDIVPAWRP
jgi:uncharacterized protein with PIN domain